MPKDQKNALRLCKCEKCRVYKSIDNKTGRERMKNWKGVEVDMEGIEKTTWQATLQEDDDVTMEGGVLFNTHTSAGPSGQPRRHQASDDEGEGQHRESDDDESRGEGDREVDVSSITVELKEWGNRLHEAREAFHSQSKNIDVIHFEETSPVDLTTIPPLHHVANQELVRYRTFLTRLQDHLGDVHVVDEDDSARKANLLASIGDELQMLQRAVVRAWEARKIQLAAGSAGVTHADERQGHHTTAKVVFAYLATVVCLALMDNVSRTGTSFLLVMMRSIVAASCIQYVRICSGANTGQTPNPLAVLSNGQPWPTDLRTAIEALELDPDTVVMACCKVCRSIYEPTSDKNAPYPITCTYKAFPSDDPCGAKLVKDTNKATPLYPFLYQRMENWLNRMLSRKVIVEGIQEMSSAWARGAAKITDMIFAKGLRELLGPDGRPFMEARAGELRLAFTLNVDWFNPFGRRTAGKHASVGGIYMVCMSLPIHLRYRVENIYLVGIIPGPNEPNVNQINHVLRPLVDSLLRFWHAGVRFTWTAGHPHGCLVRAVVAALICDIPAMRKVGGFAGHSANLFCSFCKLLRSQIANLERATWPPRTREDHLDAATRYKQAEDKKSREKEFEENGVRWSELLRLPYWEPLQFGVLDSMHNLFLNNCKYQCREVFGMDSGVGSNKKMPPHDTVKQTEEIEKVRRALEKGEKNAMGKVRKSYLEAFVALNFVRVAKNKPTKSDLVDALAEWRKADKNAAIAVPEALPYPIYNFPLPGKREVILNAIVLMEVVNDIKKTSLPNWIAPPPQNLGSKKQGKLSADQWRTICTISLVVTLIRLWSGGGPFSTAKRWLDNFLDLVIAIRYTTKRSVSDESISVVEEHILKYLQGLVELFGPEVLTINHHLSLHLPDFLRRLGPVHGWWTFAFERYNGIIQRFNTNNKFGELLVIHFDRKARLIDGAGELESTFMRTFCRGGNLRSMMAELPDADSEGGEGILSTLKTAFDDAFSTQFRGTLKSDLLALGSDGKAQSQDTWIIGQEEHLLPTAVYSLVSSRIDAESAYATYGRRSQLVKRIKLRGLDFTTKAESKGNAQILFRTKSAEGEMVNAAGQIDTIFRHRYRPALSNEDVVKTYFVVKRYGELKEEDAHCDPYRKYPRLDVRLCYNTFEDQPYIVSKDEIVAHIATCPVQWEDRVWMVILNLDRVEELSSKKKFPGGYAPQHPSASNYRLHIGVQQPRRIEYTAAWDNTAVPRGDVDASKYRLRTPP
ncbi:hypothetical protein NMY22_g8740 [Coprinellus aureogranulatus]|nr:hypothetical protein NMY22_g8740 [Coprinellus aureogranulatus]